MARLSELQLDEGAAPQVDWDAPEAGMSPPPIYPGTYTLLFKLAESPEEWFDMNEVPLVKGVDASKKKFLVINYQPSVVLSHATRDTQGVPVPNDPQTNLPIQLGPQRASFFKTDKMQISEGAELLRAMGVRIEGSLIQQIEGALQQLNGKATFMAEVGWRAYFKGTDTTVTTHPKGKKSGNLLWPRKADGTPELLAVNPASGEKMYGYAVVAKIIAPHA